MALILQPGGSVRRTLYLQSGVEPADGDLLVGMVDSGPLAAYVCEAVSARLMADVREGIAQIERFALAPTCIRCGIRCFWCTGEPTMQAAGWRHADQAGSYAVGAHRPVFGRRR